MIKPNPQFIREIKREFRDNRFRQRFEYDTGYPIAIYKNDTELATAFILHREEVEFEYGKKYPEHGERRCEVDFFLPRPKVFRPLPTYLNVVQWPHRKPVRWIEIKRNVHRRYDPKPEEEIKKLMEGKWKSADRALLQREFLKIYGVETFPIGEGGLGYFYHKGLLADE